MKRSVALAMGFVGVLETAPLVKLKKNMLSLQVCA